MSTRQGLISKEEYERLQAQTDEQRSGGGQRTKYRSARAALGIQKGYAWVLAGILGVAALYFLSQGFTTLGVAILAFAFVAFMVLNASTQFLEAVLDIEVNTRKTNELLEKLERKAGA